MKLNQRLKNIRKRAKVTQKELATHLGITIRTYQRYEEGTIEPPLATICEIANFFDLPTDCLLGNGFFHNREEIILHKDAILRSLQEVISEFLPRFDLSRLTESDLARILPAIYEKIDITGNIIEIYYNASLAPTP